MDDGWGLTYNIDADWLCMTRGFILLNSFRMDSSPSRSAVLCIQLYCRAAENPNVDCPSLLNYVLSSPNSDYTLYTECSEAYALGNEWFQGYSRTAFKLAVLIFEYDCLR